MTEPVPNVVITDMGLVTAAGTGVDASWRQVAAGRTCIGPVKTFDASVFPTAIGAELIQQPPARQPDDERSVRMLLAAGDEVAAGLIPWLDEHPEERDQLGVVLGTSQGAILGVGDVHRRLRRGGGQLKESDLHAFHTYRPGYGTERLAQTLGARGPRSTVGMVCVSSAMALIQAVELIRNGVVDRVVAGGFEGFSPFIFTGFFCIGAMTKTVCRPFDQRRDGTALGEGAALLLLESEEAAARRGAEPIAVFEGGGFAADAVHMTAPDREGHGLERAIRQAFGEARRSPDQVQYINAHGTGTPYNDSMECQAFSRVFAEAETMPPLSSLKSIFGHTLGAAGCLDAVLCMRAFQEQALPPTVNSGEAPEVEYWDFVPGKARKTAGLDRILSTNAAFGGNNTALIFRRWGA